GVGGEDRGVGRVTGRDTRRHHEEVVDIDGDRSAHPQRVDGGVARDGEEPGRHTAAARVEDRSVAPRPHEHLLRDVFSRARVAADRECEAVHPALETGEERRRHHRVGPREAGEERVVGQVTRVGATVRPPGFGIGGHPASSASRCISLRHDPKLTYYNTQGYVTYFSGRFQWSVTRRRRPTASPPGARRAVRATSVVTRPSSRRRSRSSSTRTTRA